MTTTPRPARWPALMTRETAAEYLGLSLTTFDAARSEGRLPAPWAHGFDSRPRWRRADLDARIAGAEDAGFDPFIAALGNGQGDVAGRSPR